MCGVAAIIHKDHSKEADPIELNAALDAIVHRGPDGYGIHIEKNVGLGHRRLSIIDLDTGDQPMTDTESGVTVVFNGEIYNYIELRKELQTEGFQFKTKSDTEVIIKAYLKWGKDCVHHFNGMWGFILTDPKKELVFASRDRLGIKPLHVYQDNEKIIIASEIKSILAFSQVNTTWNLHLLDIYMTLGYFPSPYTFYNGIEKVPPGHSVLIHENRYSCFQYWDLPDIDENNLLKDEQFVHEQFEELFADSVKLRMRADVPFGAFLSGGLDSSSVVSVMSGMTDLPIETFTIGFNEKEFDERDIAYDVAKMFKTSHNAHEVSADTFEDSLARVLFHHDEPFGDSSSLPTDYVSKYASQKVKMVLTGDGGDEVLSGYPAYQFEKMMSIGKVIPNPIKSLGANILLGFGKGASGNMKYKLDRYANVLKASTMSFNDRVIRRASWLDTDLKSDLFLHKNQYPIQDYMADFMKGCSFKDDFYKMMYYNLKLTLPEDMLTKVDRMSMANSLETRIPFLDYRLVEFMSKVDKSIKMKRLERKSVLRSTIGKSLPASVLGASKKGFVTPLREWFKTKEVEVLAKTYFKNVEGVLDQTVLNELFDKNKQGKGDYGNLLWMISLLSARLEK